jgi:hypothetical protein
MRQSFIESYQKTLLLLDSFFLQLNLKQNKQIPQSTIVPTWKEINLNLR